MESLLIVKPQVPLKREQREAVRAWAEEARGRIGMEVLVTEPGIDIDVHSDIAPLVEAMQAQTAAITELVAVNQELIATLLDDEDQDPDAQPSVDLSGRPI